MVIAADVVVTGVVVTTVVVVALKIYGKVLASNINCIRNLIEI